jgi:hypothetical protein
MLFQINALAACLSNRICVRLLVYISLFAASADLCSAVLIAYIPTFVEHLVWLYVRCVCDQNRAIADPEHCGSFLAICGRNSQCQLTHTTMNDKRVSEEQMYRRAAIIGVIARYVNSRDAPRIQMCSRAAHWRAARVW